MKERFVNKLEEVIANGPFQDDWDSLTGFQVPDWIMDGKFGIFIHWGIYSVPAFGDEWYPRNMYQAGTPTFDHHVATYGAQREFGYKDFIPLFTGEKFDPHEWVDLFRKAGARYVIPVAEHHDGFQMYDSELSNWNSVQMGPGRDIIGELAAAVREEGLIFGLSNHRAEHYFFLDGGLKFESDVNDPRWADFYGPPNPAPGDLLDLVDASPSQEHMEDWLARNCELVDKYRPQMVYFDWWIQNLAFKPYIRKFAAYYYNQAAVWGKPVAISYKHKAFPDGTALYDIERGQVAAISARFWQGDTSVSKNSWGYISNHDYKTADTIICDLVDTVCKNGALLLNVGPRADGTIPEPEQEILLEIGAWLAVNGEAIYGTTPWKVFGEGPTAVVEGPFNDTKRGSFTSEDIRFTWKDGTLYAIALKWPESGRLLIKSLADGNMAVNQVHVLGHTERPGWQLNQNGLEVDLHQLPFNGFPGRTWNRITTP